MSKQTKKKYDYIETAVVVMAVITVYVSLLANFSVYYLWPNLKVLWLGIYLPFCLIAFYIRPQLVKESLKVPAMFLVGWALVYMICIVINHDSPPGGLSVSVIQGCVFLSLRSRIEWRVVSVFVWSFSILLCLSIAEYLVFLFTGKGVVLAFLQRGDYNQYFIQLLFNVFRADASLPRFCSLVEEPGLLGTLCCFLLFVTEGEKKYRFPWCIFLISGMLTFSLAFYALLAVYAVYKMRSIKYAAIMAMMIIIGYFSFTEFAETLIVERVTSKDADNRTTEEFDRYFQKSFESGSLWVGNGSKLPYQLEISGGNAGGKVFIYQYGIIGFLMLFVMYNCIFVITTKKLSKPGAVFLLVFWLSFYQRQTIDQAYTVTTFVGEALTSGGGISV